MYSLMSGCAISDFILACGCGFFCGCGSRKKYKKQFTTYDPGKLPDVYERVKSKIMKGSTHAKEKTGKKS